MTENRILFLGGPIFSLGTMTSLTLLGSNELAYISKGSIEAAARPAAEVAPLRKKLRLLKCIVKLNLRYLQNRKITPLLVVLRIN